MKKTLIKIDKKLDDLPNTPIFKESYEKAKLFLANLKINEKDKLKK
mgnify:CR=1 FL=1